MAEETGKPKRKRRRWIIAGVLLFVVSCTSWWYWPRGDQRFVGTWSASLAGQAPHRLILKSHGTGAWETNDGRVIPFSWRISGNQLVIGRELSRSLQRAVAWFNFNVLSYFGNIHLQYYEERWDYAVLSDDELRLSAPEGSSGYELKRIRE